MQRTRVKICGLKEVSDIEIAAQAGTDAIGLNHYPKSPRFVDVDRARYLANKTPLFINIVSVVSNADEREIETIINKVQPRYIQFHGDESAAFCEQFDYPYIRAVRVRHADDINEAYNAYTKASALLLDTYDPNLFGGAGETFNWDLIPSALRHQVILAGGLNAENVASAIDAIKPYAVDVSSGVESEKGVKDPKKIVAFIDAVNATLTG